MTAAADYWIKQALLLTCTPPMAPGKNYRELAQQAPVNKNKFLSEGRSLCQTLAFEQKTVFFLEALYH
jgi:hypothetical protein